MFDLDKIQLHANAYASILSCKINRDGNLFTMIDESGEEVDQVTIEDGGQYDGRQMMVVTDDDGKFFIEAFGQLLAKIMWC